MVSKRISTRILVLSDTHSALPDRAKYPHLKFSQGFPEADVAIHCGDLTSTGKLEEHKRALTLLKSLPAPIKIVIPGNHDMTLDETYMSENSHLHGWTRSHTANDLQEAKAIYTSQEAWDAGIRYLVEGLDSFVLPNGAKLTAYVSAFTPEFYNWAFAYPRSYDRFNTTQDRNPENPVPGHSSAAANSHLPVDEVTVMVTHGPPHGILDKTMRGESVGCEHLMTAVSRCRPLLHCFGHIHEAWGAELRLWPSDTQQTGLIGSKAVELEQRGQRTEMVAKEPRFAISHPTESLGFLEQNSKDKTDTVSVIDGTSLEQGKHTVFVNASIMDLRYVPRQWPWLVQLELPEASGEEDENI